MTGQKLQAQAAGFEESTPDQAVDALLVPEELQGALSVWYDRCTGAVADEGLHCTEGIEFTRAQSELVCPGEFGTPDDVPILNYPRRRRVVCERNERRKLGTSRSIALDREAQCPSTLKFFEGCPRAGLGDPDAIRDLVQLRAERRRTRLPRCVCAGPPPR